MIWQIKLFNLFVITIAVSLPNYHVPREAELDGAFWEGEAQSQVFKSYARQENRRKAKNVIIFVGGGMGITTITPARILKGQLKGHSGEEERLTFEKFPNTCLLKTYTIDNQVADTEGTATALLSGVKTNNGVIGATARVKKGESSCETLHDNMVTSIFDFAAEAGKRTGIVTNTRVTKGVAAGAYASIANGDWEDSIPLKLAYHPTLEDCKDVARQLVENHPGKHLNVILGAGGRYLYPKNYTGPLTGISGRREDGINLVQKWIDSKKETGISSEHFKLVYTREELSNSLSKYDLDYLLGIFQQDRMSFEKERDSHREPSLEDMTEAAITVLKKNDKGFLLLVEGGLIDLAHHGNLANMALYETLALERAIDRALRMVSIEDTLIVVTADHSQALTMNGNPKRGHNIMGIAGNDHQTHLAYTTLLYSNGPGYKKNRSDPTNIDTAALAYQSHAGIFLSSSYHTGEDVGQFILLCE